MSAASVSRASPVLFEDCVDSTNLYLRRMADTAADGTAVVAASQSAGRGRMGRSFLSPEGGLYLSVLLRPETDPERLPTLTPAAAVAVCRAVDELCGVHCGIKWPNDVLLDGKKICGILVESVLGGEKPCVIVGIGINANTASFPEELRPIAGSIAEASGRRVDLHALAEALLRELDGLYAAWLSDAGAALEEYRSRCASCGREVIVGERRGFALRVGDDYSLLVRFSDGAEEALRFGEVSVRGLYGA
ncbi:MAG: biotin--[Oscillospiraceae bacterium]|nr:biotin--[acetyl-CoA-carboxylase] ligase [Oscillospiraceae bacterium]MBR0207828.1 biotin--[acetyl-CoA-carboxylase] ligase [Oscillospiraceae bacterium]